MSGSPTSSSRVRLRLLPVVLAALVLGPAAAAQAPAPAAPLRLHGLVEAVEFFSVVAPPGTNGQLTPVPEPSTYGALFLGSAAGLVVWIRRRRASAAHSNRAS